MIELKKIGGENMVQIAIVDDDVIMLDKIKKMLEERLGNDCEIDTYSDSTDFYHNSEKWNYDIVFLDIDMPKISGFKIAETMNLLKRQTEIVFVSNLEHLVFDSIKFKPFRFACKSKLEKDIPETIDSFIIDRNKRKDVFIINTNGISIPTVISDIIYFESVGHDIYAKTSSNEMHQLLREREKNITLKSLSEQLKDKGFIRIQKSFLLNYRYIYVVKPTEVILKNNDRIIINPHKANMIRTAFQHFIIKEGEI